jgi:hypothetical protein
VPAESADVIDTVNGSLPLIVAVIAITTFVRLAGAFAPLAVKAMLAGRIRLLVRSRSGSGRFPA